MKKLNGNWATLILTAIIIAAGVVLPPLIYPFIDQYSDRVTQLQAPDTASNVFQEAVSLYPWNVYDESQTRDLFNSELNKIDSSGVPDYLMAFLSDRGVDVTTDPQYRQKLLASFRYLNVADNSAEDCFVLEQDLDGDGNPDIRCAVDLNGNVISTLLLSTQYQTIQLALPADVSPTDTAATGSTSGAGSDTTTGSTSGTGSETTTGSGETAGGGSGGSGSGGNTSGSPSGADATVSSNKDATAGGGADAATDTDASASNTSSPVITGADTGSDTNGNAPANTDTDSNPPGEPSNTNTPPPAQTASDGGTVLLSIPDPSQAAINENLNTWAFVYTTHQEAAKLSSPLLAASFMEVDAYFQVQYGYVFTNYLRVLNGLTLGAENAIPDSSPNLKARVLTNNEYQLNIYTLSNSQRLILYLDPATRVCLGFTIQDLASS